MVVAERTRSTYSPDLHSPGDSLLARPLVLAAVALAVGIAAQSQPILILPAVAAAACWLSAPRIRRRWGAAPALLWVSLVVGGALLSYADRLAKRSELSSLADGRYVTVRGAISRDVDASAREIKCVISVDEIALPAGDRTPITGEVLLRLGRSEESAAPEYGDRVEARGRLERPPAPGNAGDFDFGAYLERQGISAILTARRPSAWRVLESGASASNLITRAAVRAQQSLRASYSADLPRGESGLLIGIVLGGRADIPTSITDDFTATGSVHILSASGMNVAMTALLLTWLGRLLHLRRRVGTVAAIVALAFYTLMAGATPSVVRADIMCTTFMFATLLQREPDMGCAIALSAIILLLKAPSDLFDIGFQLSFAAVIAIVALVPTVQARIQTIKLKQSGLPDRVAGVVSACARYVLTVVAVTTAAQLGTMPLTAQYFNQISLVGLPANILILAPIDLLMRVGFGVWLLTPLSSSAARLVASVAVSPFLALMIGAAHLFASIPGAVLSVPSPGCAAMSVYYLALAYGAVLLRRRLAVGATA